MSKKIKSNLDNLDLEGVKKIIGSDEISLHTKLLFIKACSDSIDADLLDALNQQEFMGDVMQALYQRLECGLYGISDLLDFEFISTDSYHDYREEMSNIYQKLKYVFYKWSDLERAEIGDYLTLYAVSKELRVHEKFYDQSIKGLDLYSNDSGAEVEFDASVSIIESCAPWIAFSETSLSGSEDLWSV